jgi:thiol-disulfide isomerase/thioredoxin
MQENKKMDNGKGLWTPARLSFTLAVLSLVAAFGGSSCSSSDERRPEPPGPSRTTEVITKTVPAPGPKPAPAVVTTLPASVINVEMRAVSGEPIKLSNYEGKVLVVNLWATWCGPCRMETPELVKLYKEFRSKGLEVVGLSTENPDSSIEGVKQFVQDYNINYRIGWSPPEVSIALMQGREAIPQSFVISRSGRLIRRFVGFNPNDTPTLIKEAIEEGLNEKATAD